MKGIVLTSHGPMAQGMLETSKLFFGEQEQLTARCLFADMNPDEFDEDLKKAIEEVDTGDGVIVLCDMLFGSPCNCMIRIVAPDVNNDNVQVVAGLNLAMVLQALATREAGDPDVDDLVNAGKDGVADVKALLRAKFVVKKANKLFTFSLKASNGEVIADSISYKAKAACMNGIQTLIKIAAAGNIEDQTADDYKTIKGAKFVIYKDDKDEFRFDAKSNSGKVVATSEGYTSKQACLNGIDSVVSNAPKSKIVTE